jgi:hypothetical protein
LIVVSSVAPCLLRHLPSELMSPHHRAIVDAFAAGPPSPFADHHQPLSVAILLSIKRLCRSR